MGSVLSGRWALVSQHAFEDPACGAGEFGAFAPLGVFGVADGQGHFLKNSEQQRTERVGQFGRDFASLSGRAQDRTDQATMEHEKIRAELDGRYPKIGSD